MLSEKDYKFIYGDDIDEVLAKRKARDDRNFNIVIILTVISMIGLLGFDIVWFMGLFVVAIILSFNNFCIRDAEKFELMEKYFKFQEEKQKENKK